MELHHLLHHGKADAVALRGMGLVRLIEFSPDSADLVLGDIGAVVGDGDGQRLRPLGNPHADLPVVGGILDGIVQQIDPDLFQQFLVRPDGIFREFQIEVKLFAAPLFFQQKHAGTNLFRQVEGGQIR